MLKRMNMVFLELETGLGGHVITRPTVAAWIPASNILSFNVVRHYKDESRLRLEIVISDFRHCPVTPWFDSLEQVESVRRQLIRLLADAQPTQVVRWKGSAFVCEDS